MQRPHFGMAGYPPTLAMATGQHVRGAEATLPSMWGGDLQKALLPPFTFFDFLFSI